jgi:hypothetical protein
MSAMVISISAMEKAPTPRGDNDQKQKSPLKRQDSQRGSLLSRIAKEASDKGLPTVAKAMLQLDNKSPERDNALAELEKDPKKKEELLERAASAYTRNPSPAKESAAFQQYRSHCNEAYLAVDNTVSFLQYKNIEEALATKNIFVKHYHLAIKAYIQHQQGIDPNKYEWEYAENAFQVCKPIRKQYEERVERFLAGTKEPQKSGSKIQLKP